MSNVLCMWSGGLDSTGMLYWLLEETDHTVVVHHIQMHNAEGRWRGEKRAVEKCRDWLDEHCRPFSFTESSYSLIGVNPPPDQGVIGFMAAQVASKLSIDLVCIGSMVDDNRLHGIIERREMRDKVFDAALSVEPKPSIWMPMKDWTKQQIHDYLPERLRQHTWTCRRPIMRYTPCGDCRACHDYKAVAGEVSAFVRNRPGPFNQHPFLQYRPPETT